MPALAFWTTGDTWPACDTPASVPPGTRIPQNSDSYEALAHQLAGRDGVVRGVASIQAAMQIVRNAIVRNVRFRRIYFVGHGRRTGDFIFHGRRIAENSFHHEGQWSSTDNAARGPFASLVAQAAAPDAHVWMYYCWSRGNLAQALIGAGIDANRIHATHEETVVHSSCFRARDGHVGVRPQPATRLSTGE